MKVHRRASALASLATLAGLIGCSTPTPTSTPPAPATPGPLFETISTLDAAVFSAFNACADPGQLQAHAEYFSEAVEFYHDNGGVTWNRQAMLANTRQHVCGNFRRELVPGSLRVYPISNFGAIAQGAHRFCQFTSGACEGAADFVIVWQQQGHRWVITRVLSYGHRPL